MARRAALVFGALAILLAAVGVSNGLRAADDPAADKKPPNINWVKAYDLLEKERAGEKLTTEQSEFLERAKAAFGQSTAARAGGDPTRRFDRPAANIKPSLGFKPLSDMTADDKYQGQEGGLYGGGKNSPPAEHLAAALKQAAEIKPLDADGKASASGKIGLISVGMSNTTQEFTQFMQIAGEFKNKSPAVKLVDGAQGGQEGSKWANTKQPWDGLDARLKQADVSPQQVQVAWIKQARANPAALGAWPKHNEALEKDLIVCLNMLHERFPNLRIAYLSSRIYAGNASTQLNPEPYAYENAFALRHLIQQQIAGEASLNYDPKRGPVKSPLLLWGPYLWADGETPRKSDGLTYSPRDFGNDGTHPSQTGRQKVAEQLLKFLSTDETAKSWFVAGKKSRCG